MTPAQLSRTVLHTVRRAVEADELCVDVPERVKVRIPPRGGCGDYATNVALQLARGRGEGAAARIAEVLRRRLVEAPGIAGVDIAGPGFLNITLDARSHEQLVEAILEQGDGYGLGGGLAGVHARFAPADEVRAALVLHAVVGLVEGCGGSVDVGVGGEVISVRAAGGDARELLTRLGSDAARWGLLRAAAHDLPDLDPAHLLAQREGNPLFRVRYAHAVTHRSVDEGDEGVEGLDDLVLLGLLGDFPRTVEAAARHRSPDRLARHLVAVADAYLGQADNRRKRLAEATRVVLANGLRLLGISAPKRL
ncbi:DALR anticodon-binding domain-containing protein [Streptomyces sp. NPDC005962]|uniref:DALR anticodon-binding domain-containing protein n=1 Tax=Streptomyces sp. NPDC005962 TaxID=3154466 RepID=UPI0033C7B170